MLAWLVFALLLSACSRSAAPAGGNARDSIRIVVVTHGQSSDPFWSVVSNGVRAAAASWASAPSTRRRAAST
jgi:ABC-type sugar transport system substrate-binding protein